MEDSIHLPNDLAKKATQEAAERGMSLPEFVRVQLERVVSSRPANDSLFADNVIFSDNGPTTLASEHDQELYEDAP